MVCTFFGHRDTPWNTQEFLTELLREMIIKENADTFLVGNQGNFDRIVLNVLKNRVINLYEKG